MAQSRRPYRPRFRFSEVGIPRRAVLCSKHDDNIKCIVVRDDEVKFEGEVVPLREATKTVLVRLNKGTKWREKSLHPSQHWEYRGKLLRKRHEEAYPRDSDSWQVGEEKIPEEGMPEGAARIIQVNGYERNPKNREAAIKIHGTRCKGCEKKMEEMYGEIAKGLIHIHHVKPLAAAHRGRSKSINIRRDLKPLCPNCHAVVHRRNPPLSIDELKKWIKRGTTGC